MLESTSVTIKDPEEKKDDLVITPTENPSDYTNDQRL
jgi:hypothetical protein